MEVEEWVTDEDGRSGYRDKYDEHDKQPDRSPHYGTVRHYTVEQADAQVDQPAPTEVL